MLRQIVADSLPGSEDRLHRGAGLEDALQAFVDQRQIDVQEAVAIERVFQIRGLARECREPLVHRHRRGVDVGAGLDERIARKGRAPERGPPPELPLEIDRLDVRVGGAPQAPPTGGVDLPDARLVETDKRVAVIAAVVLDFEG